MLVVRDVFTTKPGQASKLAGLFKRTFTVLENARVMTDRIGEYNTVVLEIEVESLAAYEQIMNDYESGKAMEKLDDATKQEMKNYTDLWITGRREIFRVV